MHVCIHCINIIEQNRYYILIIYKNRTLPQCIKAGKRTKKKKKMAKINWQL